MMEASKELMVSEERVIVTKKDIDDWLFGSGTKLSDQQKALFYQVCLSNNLNPIKREVYAIPYGNNFNVITGYEVYLKRAERTGKLDGWDASVEDVQGELVGRCTVWRKDRSYPTTIEAWFKEYDQGNKMWKEKPRTMIRKVAIAQAFRMAFPDEIGGLPYTSDEIAINAEIIPEPKEPPKLPKPPKTDGLQDRVQKCLKAWETLGFSQDDLETLTVKPIPEWTTETLSWLAEEYKKEKARQA